MHTGVIEQLDLASSTAKELATNYRLMPVRPDQAALIPHAAQIAAWLEPQFTKGLHGTPAEIIYVDKESRGLRPISQMSLGDRVLFRALVDSISRNIPPELMKRPPITDFYHAPVPTSQTTGYISKTDITAFYEYIDHGILEGELLAQTGEALAIDLLMKLLEKVMGRKLGIPQVHSSSDILGDIYIDPVRRKMTRSGISTWTYSDDFRIYSKTLSEAKSALAMCAIESRAIGLVLNEGKTLTYSTKKYTQSLSKFATDEIRLFGSEAAAVLSARQSYEDLTIRPEASFEGSNASETPALTEPSSDSLKKAADAVWEAWARTHLAGGEPPPGEEAPLLRRLVGDVLPTMGAVGDERPLEVASRLLRTEPSLTPAVSRYFAALAQAEPEAPAAVRSCLDSLVAESSFSDWQKLWLADTAGTIPPGGSREHPHHSWLIEQIQGGSNALAASCAAAAGRLGIGEPTDFAAAVNRVGPVWRSLTFWGFVQRAPDMAADVADNQLDRLMLEAR